MQHRPRLFCLPPAGAGPSLYRPWAGRHAAHVEVVPVSLPGRESRISEPLSVSLDALAELVQEARVEILLPGHGAPRTDAAQVIAGYATHRHERLEQVREVLRGLGVGELGAARLDPEQSSEARDDLVERVVETVYAQVPREVWPAARLSVRAQLDYLADDRP